MERKKRRVISEECKQKVVELRKGGLTYKEIAQLCGLYRADHARQICEKAGFLKTNAEMRNEQIFALRKDGLLYDEIAERLNVPKNIVQRVCNKNGLSYSREEQRKVAHEWAVNHPSKGCYDSYVEKIKNRIPDYMEYIGGYDGSAGYVTIRCKDCGAEFERSVQAIRKKQVKYCPCCRKEQTEQREREREERRIMREAQEEAWRRAREQKERERSESTKQVDCVVCGKRFETRRPNKLCCSQECSRKYANRYHDKRIAKDKRVDFGINARSLYKRDKGVCWICGGQCDLNDYITKNGYFVAGDWYPSVDHIVPICDGGEDSWENVKLAHRTCNTRRYMDEKTSRHKKSV